MLRGKWRLNFCSVPPHTSAQCAKVIMSHRMPSCRSENMKTCVCDLWLPQDLLAFLGKQSKLPNVYMADTVFWDGDLGEKVPGKVAFLSYPTSC